MNRSVLKISFSEAVITSEIELHYIIFLSRNRLLISKKQNGLSFLSAYKAAYSNIFYETRGSNDSYFVLKMIIIMSAELKENCNLDFVMV